MKTTLLSAVFIVCAASFLFSQEMKSQSQDTLQSEEIKVEFEPIVVTAMRSERSILRVPYAIDVVRQEEIQRAEVGLSLDEVARAVPGIVVNNRYDQSGGDRISIRGVGIRSAFGVRGVKMILDGIPLTIPDGQTQLENLDLASAGVIEILRGPSSSLYGNAAGGLINIRTQDAAPMSSQAQPRYTIGSDGYWKWQGKFSGTIGKHAYFVNINKLHLDGYREHSSVSSMNLNAVGRHAISDNLKLTSVFNYIDAPYFLSPSTLSKTDAKESPTKARDNVKEMGAGKELQNGQGGITLKFKQSETSQFEATLYGYVRSVFVATPGWPTGRIIELDRHGYGLRTVYDNRFHLRSSYLRWTVGTDIEVQDGTQTEYENWGLPEDQVSVATGSDIFNLLDKRSRILDQDEKVLGLGPFTELEFTPHPKWIMTLGGRYDYYKFEAVDHYTGDGSDDSGKRNMDRLSPMVGLVYRPHDLVKVYGNYSSAFQTPTTNELRNLPTGKGGLNPSLEPEIMRSVEIGVSGMWPFGMTHWPGRRFMYDLSLYFLTIDDMLIPFQAPNTEEEYFRNAGKTRSKGAELQFDWYPVKGLRASLAYTFMDFLFKDFEVETTVGDTIQRVQLEGNDVPGVPSHQMFAAVAYEHPVGAYSEINLRWVDDYFANDFNGPSPGSDQSLSNFINDAYTVVDLRFGFQRSFNTIGGELFLGINNLFDKRYNSAIVPNAFGNRFFYPAPGRTWYGGISVLFPGSK